MKKMSMRSWAFAAGLFLLSFIAGCSRSNTNTSPQGTYFFNATFLGQSLAYNNQFIQYGDNYQDVKGYVPNANLSQAGGVSLDLHGATPKATVLGLANTTYYFDNGTITPDLIINSGSFNFYHAMYTTDHSYFVKVDQISFLKSDSLFGNPIDIYAVGGSFKAKMQDPNTGSYAGDASGTFNIQCSAYHN